MKYDMHHLELILDQSGSMQGINDSTYAGARELIADLRDDGTVRLSTFNSSLRQGTTMTKEEALAACHAGRCDGTTALYDAICTTLHRLLQQPPSAAEGAVVVAIVTDGVENASRSFTRADVRSLVKRAHDRGWRVTFLGANQDAVMTAESFGIRRERALSYGTTDHEVLECFRALSASNRRFASGEDEAFTEAERVSSLGVPSCGPPHVARSSYLRSAPRAVSEGEVYRWISIDPVHGTIQDYDGAISARLDDALRDSCASVPVDEFNATIHLQLGGSGHLQKTATGERDVRRVAVGTTLQVKVCGENGYRVVPIGDRIVLVT